MVYQLRCMGIPAKLRDNFQFKNLLKLINLFGILWVNLRAKTNSTLPLSPFNTHTTPSTSKRSLFYRNVIFVYDLMFSARFVRLLMLFIAHVGRRLFQIFMYILYAGIPRHNTHPYPHAHTHNQTLTQIGH